MNKFNYKISLYFFALLLIANKLSAQAGQDRLLLRDSLDFKTNAVGLNSSQNEFNPIPYKGGLLYTSNKKTSINPLGFNKVYWVPNALIATDGKDTLIRKVKLNDDYTAPTSNDNNILTHYIKPNAKKAMNPAEQQFANFNPDQSFAYDDSVNLIVYPKLSRAKINGKNRWELWEATLKNGKTIQDRKIKILDSAADYLYPNLTKGANELYFASNRVGGKGGFDVYKIQKVNGEWQSQPTNMEAINTDANEIYPVAKPDTLSYSSDRIGGLGGYDLYRFTNQNKLNQNLGYPINTANDDLALSSIGNQLYLTSNRSGSIDVVALNYAPVTLSIKGQLTYSNDGQLVPGQKMFIYDTDEHVLVDSLITDANANYSFIGKPNRNYEVSAINADGIKEVIAFKTNDKIIQRADIALNLLGRSPKQIKDSLNDVIAKAAQKVTDSINATGIASKFVVYYGFDKSILTKKEQKTLDALAIKIKNNKSLYLIVGAFTDCIGSYKYNYALSVKRAKYVVNYLQKKGVPKSRFTSNGYSKNYTITPCKTGANKSAQLVNRRAEILLSEVKNTNWVNLEKQRGATYYKNVYSSRNNNIAKVDSVNFMAHQEQAPKQIPKQIPIQTKLTKEAPVVVKTKDDLVKIQAKTIVKKDSVMAKVKTPVIVKKDTAVKPKLNETANKKDVIAIAKTDVKVKKDTVANTSIVVTHAKQANNDELSKAEIIKALDSLAKLKIEQERIVAYLTLRINNKPIDVYVSSDTVTVELYDNGVHDRDSVSIIYNNRIVVDRQELKVNQPIKFKLKVDKNMKNNELIMVAENLGTEPPNTAVMFITEKSGKRQQIILNTDMTHNGVVYFIRIGKQ